MKYNKKQKLSKRVWLFICAMSVYPVAFAQTPQQLHIENGRQMLNGADSSTSGYVPGVENAPKTYIGAEVGSTSQAAKQVYETQMVSNCPEGTTGINEYQRLTFVRQDGSVFANEWTLKKNNCAVNKDPAIADLYNNQTNIYNEINILKSRISKYENYGGTGNWASPPFVAKYYVYNGRGEITVLGGGGNAACISGFNVNFNPTVAVNTTGTGNTLNTMAKPYPTWKGTPRAFPNLNIEDGPLCPQGSGLNYLTGPSAQGPTQDGE